VVDGNHLQHDPASRSLKLLITEAEDRSTNMLEILINNLEMQAGAYFFLPAPLDTELEHLCL
jgi:hypothetical protein